MKKIIVAASLDQIDGIQEFVSSEMESVNCPMKQQLQVNIVLDELLSNVVRYAYPDGGGSIEVSCEASESQIAITLIDSGIPYNPLEKEDPDVTLSAEERSIGGLGIFMVKKTMDEIVYSYDNGKNILTVKKTIN